MTDSDSESQTELLSTEQDAPGSPRTLTRSVFVQTKLPFKINTTGFFLFTAIQCFDGPCRKQVGIGKAVSMLVCGALLHILNFMVQFGLTFALLEFSVQRQEDKFQRHNLLSKASLVEAAASSGVKLESTALNKEVLGVCRAEHHVPYFQSLVIFLWCVKLLPPVIQSVRFTLASIRMPSREGVKSMVLVDGSKFFVFSMPVWVKVFIFFCANLPRLLLQVFLFWMGAEYLMYATSLNVLITKAVGLAFIRSMSELLFTGLASQQNQERMKEVHLVFETNAASATKEWWEAWGAMLVKFLFCLVLALWFCRIHHGELQGFRDACFHYKQVFDVPKCFPVCGTTFLGMTLAN